MSLRRCYNSLKRAGLTSRFVVSERPEDVERALDTFFALHEARANEVDGVIHPDRFRGGRAKQFLRTVCARFAERGVTRVFTLYVNETAVASRVGFLLPGCLYLYYSGFDPEWGKYSVMTTTVAEAIKYAIDRRLPRVHLSMGADVSKTRWAPETPKLHQAICVRRRVWSRSAMRLHLWASERAASMGRLCALLPKRQFN